MIATTAAAVTSTAISTRPALLAEHLSHLYPMLLVYPSLQTEQSIAVGDEHLQDFARDGTARHGIGSAMGDILS